MSSSMNRNSLRGEGEMNDIIQNVEDDKSPSMYGILAGICKDEIWSFKDETLVLTVMYSY